VPGGRLDDGVWNRARRRWPGAAPGRAALAASSALRSITVPTRTRHGGGRHSAGRSVSALPPFIELVGGSAHVSRVPDHVWTHARDVREATSIEDFARAQKAGLLWVAATPEDAPVGFALLRELDGVHLDELDVYPSHGRRGLGSALLRRVCEWAQSAGRRGVTLSRFRGTYRGMRRFTRGAAFAS
jgi:GNAT superfamily N-acetyltransferase